MRYIPIVMAVAGWVLMALLLNWVGGLFAFLVLRSIEVRPRSLPPDWIDSAVGITVLLLVAALLLWLRLCAYRRCAGKQIPS